MKLSEIAVPVVLFSLIASVSIARTGFSIQLPKKEISEEEIKEIKIDELEGVPLISESDIISYDRRSHSLFLNPISCEKLDALKTGTILFICVDNMPIYCAALWHGGMAIGYQGVVILRDRYWNSRKCSIQIQCGYPTIKVFSGVDLRDDPKILDALRAAGKLKEN